MHGSPNSFTILFHKKTPRDIYINLFKIIYKKTLLYKKKIYSMLNFFNTKSYIININQGSR